MFPDSKILLIGFLEYWSDGMLHFYFCFCSLLLVSILLSSLGEGEISAEDDIFDFQSAPWGERDYWKEVVTRFLGSIPNGQPFTIHIKGSTKVSESGAL